MLSYHSLEDRPVKQCFQRLAGRGAEDFDEEGDSSFGRGNCGQSRGPQRENARCEKIDSDSTGRHKGSVAAMTESSLSSHIDNCACAPDSTQSYARMRAPGLLACRSPVCIPLCWQHFETIQLRYHLESLRGERTQAAELNQDQTGSAAARAGRIDIIARVSLA